MTRARMNETLTLPEDGTPGAALSRPDIAVRSFEGGGARGIDARAFRMWFAPKFAEYLKARFATPEQVATAYGVRHSTAWAWWHGDNRASGDSVALTFLYFPDAVAWFLREWERR